MKKLGKLKLNVLSDVSLAERQMNAIRGGNCSCGCGCLYAGTQGGSSTASNRSRNVTYGYFSPWSYWVYCNGKWNYVEGGVPRNSDW
jgi:natural product precursor